MLAAHGDWMLLGSADEQKPAAEGTVESWARSPRNPVGGWYGLKKGLRGRFATVSYTHLEVLTIAVRFEGYAGRYVFHCHMLEHEDNDMMRPYEVVENN